MKVLVIGSGGREHALCWAIAASPIVGKLYCAPGNGGIADVAECVPVKPLDFDAIVRFCRDQAIDFVVVGPDDPIALGLVDRLTEAGVKSFGPSAAAAKLESSKGFTKDLCAEFDIPTAAYGRFADAATAKNFARGKGAPIVVKADGLAAGKGVIIAETVAEAEAAIDEIFSGRFGAAGAEVVIEEFLEGEEASFFVLCDGTHTLPLATAQDHKRVFDGDKGPNTGGMGAYSPAPVMTPEMCDRVMREIVEPTVKAMASRGTPFKGVLFAGLMITKDGPKLIEYNARFGDPETQVLMMRLKSDILPALIACHDGMLDKVSLQWKDEAALTVVMASKGYPGDYKKDTIINGLKAASALAGVQIFHAGTRTEGGRVLATGGRVLNVTATGKTVAEAQAKAYRAVGLIDWPEGFCRRDIGWRAIERERGKA
ncbi:MAG: phosphoribosylamine--glycine ligase [Parvibaculum sp.]|uniref:phosphoribosylamine--glycine ligase n=1 Tax=Parvibaculum sp. TaxID=2024848 RepID=UPI002844CFCB|nr:phosphoribosylamine--glycine ligase [Parvibaculum sp.]MDR3498314.1 phosphoribosylamine--glycine ligase [Parvibaculum sp.]